MKKLGLIRKRLTWKGKTLTVQEWAHKFGLSPEGLLYRLSKGIPLEKALTAPKGTHFFPKSRKRKKITWKGKTLSMQEWAERIGLSADGLWSRLSNDVPLEKALTAPKGTHFFPNSRKRKKITWQGKTLTVQEWAERIGLSDRGLSGRFAKGMPLGQALTTAKTHQRKFLSFQGETLSMTQWAKRIGVDLSTLSHRLERGWSVEAALQRPLQR